VTIDTGLLQHLKLSAHASTAVYYRLLLPRLLDASITRVLYLDCDLVVKDSLLPLWQTPLPDHPVAAVAEPYFNRHEPLGLPPGTPYFNSGVMLIDLPAWRREKVSERAIEFLEHNPGRIEAWDQDALNAVLRGNWQPLPARWNQQTSHFAPPDAPPEPDPEWQECRQRPAVIHYSSKFKPWHAWCTHPLRHEYYTYLKLTPWKGFRLPEHTPWHRVKQSVKAFVNQVAGRKVFDVYA
jgi:lipopolysaccharide biosynthesis glycosyltransferase